MADNQHEIWIYSGMPTGAYTKKTNAFILQDSAWEAGAHVIEPELIEVYGDQLSVGNENSSIFFQISNTTSIEIRLIEYEIDEEIWIKFRVIKTVTIDDVSTPEVIQDITLHKKENVMWAGIAIQAQYKQVLKASGIYLHVNGSIVVTEGFNGQVIGAMNIDDFVVNYIKILAPFGIKAISSVNNPEEIEIGSYEDYIFADDFSDLDYYDRSRVYFKNIVHPIKHDGYDYTCNWHPVKIDDPTIIGTGVSPLTQYLYASENYNMGSSLIYKGGDNNLGFAEQGYNETEVESDLVTNIDTGATSQIILYNANGNKINAIRSVGANNNFTFNLVDRNGGIIGRMYAFDRGNNAGQYITGQITPINEGGQKSVTNVVTYLSESDNIRYGDMPQMNYLVHRYFVVGIYPDEESPAFASYQYVIYRDIVYNDAEATAWWLYGSIEVEDEEDDEDKDTEPDEGKDIQDETIEDAPLPGTSALDIGVISIFNPTSQQMQDLTHEMQNQNFLDEIAKYFKNSPLEGIMSCHVVPINVETDGTDAPHFGNWQFETQMPKVSEQFYTVNFGSIKLEKKFGSFLDYSPYTHIQVYLPYIGYREIDVDDAMGKNIGVKYNFDIVTGAILAQVLIDGSVHYQFSGSAIMQFPLTASNHNNLISSIVGLVTSGATTIAGLAVGGATGGAGAAMAVGGAMSLAQSAVHTVASSKPEIQHGGSFAMTNGFLSVKTPYLVTNRPVVDIPVDFAKYTGRMSNKTKYVSECSGYTEFASVDVNMLTALEDEKAEIEQILKGGFYA